MVGHESTNPLDPEDFRYMVIDFIADYYKNIKKHSMLVNLITVYDTLISLLYNEHVLQGATGAAILCMLLATQNRILKIIRNDNIGKLVVYCSEQTHCAFKKVAQIAGIHPY
ncbi:hypothetical protein G4B88_030332 [Cannabis sativa]|uniref:Uncharacterized protein n=1 Tax=Cannabis sativa TaxID=3483 RepID=A0A7J6EBM7_CANSA|nr:hypothetical protein G4B88_030332 [Cannabis sativa]